MSDVVTLYCDTCGEPMGADRPNEGSTYYCSSECFIASLAASSGSGDTPT